MLITLEKRQGFPGVGATPSFWPCVVDLGTVMVLVDIMLTYNEHIMKLKDYWKSNLLSSWTQHVLTSFCGIPFF